MRFYIGEKDAVKELSRAWLLFFFLFHISKEERLNACGIITYLPLDAN